MFYSILLQYNIEEPRLKTRTEYIHYVHNYYSPHVEIKTLCFGLKFQGAL